MKETALYIHIPFCDHKCIYCDFYSIISYDNVNPYLSSLKTEMKYYAGLLKDERIFTSIYFGGGTPSFMEPRYIGELINTASELFSFIEEPEITLETNPGTVDKKKLESFIECGINRISIGIQSFNEDELKFLTRIHDKETAVQTVRTAANAGFSNISMDLIFNLPGQTKEKWLSNLRTAIELPIKHISAYSLILEKGTILNKMVLDGKITLQDEDYDAELYELTIDFFEANGFRQYEVSNFTLNGYECIHNNAYWHYKGYLGLGTSAHSFINGKRWHNFSSLHRYINEIEKNGHAQAGSEIISPEQEMNEYVMLALRSSGLMLTEYKNKFGEDWLMRKYDYFKLLKNNGFLKIDDDRISFTKKGYAVCDEILSNLL